MSPLPYPDPLHRHLAVSGASNRSLVWDRGVDTYDARWEFPVKKKKDDEDQGKAAFLKRFRSGFKEPDDYSRFLARRHRALEALGAHDVTLASTTRLVIGLGLSQPLDIGFLFDRLTGCPYLPGSSVKGLLRATAAAVAREELEGDASFWSEHRDALFGPAAGVEPAARGKAVFYDAFPTNWPKLELDVLTPHHREYYEEGAPPGDWYDPGPILFLALAPGTAFRFHFQSLRSQGAEDQRQLEALLLTALDWLGIGGKKSAGYGTFERSDR